MLRRMFFELWSPIISDSVIWIPWGFPITSNIYFNRLLRPCDLVKHLLNCYYAGRGNILSGVPAITHKRTVIRIPTSKKFRSLFI